MLSSRPRRRIAFAGVVGLTAAIGVTMMFDIMRSNGISVLEVVILLLFAMTFTWIALPFWNAVIGFVLTLRRRDPLALDVRAGASDERAPLSTRTALAMPVHNEDPWRVTAGLAAMLRSLERTGAVAHFDLYLLSDTTVDSIATTEEEAWRSLDTQLGHLTCLRYRRRERNIGRKAGNLADFCRRWGAHYDFMVVLDADSIMTGSALVELVRMMEANPRAGLLQTLPIPARRTTLFGRMIQFAGWVYGPLLAMGQSFWQTDTANYWGHNAIIRLGPFMEHCQLPVLPGRPPLGGQILSHDFVEAALMRRAGFEVYLCPAVDGSFEEAPETVVDYATRDRRWTQGSLQHLRLLTTPGLHFLNRVYFVLGAAGYVSSVVWLLLLLVSSVYVLTPTVGAHTVLDVSPSAARTPVPLLLVTAALLFVPKILAMITVLVGPRTSFGGPTRFLASVLLETLFAVVLAPVMMLYHTRFVASVLAGRTVVWSAQDRDGHALSWSVCGRSVGWMTGCGVLWAAVTLYFSPVFFLWLTPIFTGLVLAIPLSRWTSSRQLGDWVKRWGLLLVPAETAPPTELQDSPWSADERRRDDRIPAAPPHEVKLTTSF